MGTWTKWASRNGWVWIVQYHLAGPIARYTGCGIEYRGGSRWQHVFKSRHRGPWKLDQALDFLHIEKTAQQKRMADLGKPMNTTYRLYNIETKDIILGDIL
jgi:hypothetical protein